MKKTAAIIFLMLMLITANAQTTLKKVYDESIDPVEQINKAVSEAKTSGRYVVCQLGGNWCPWCLRFAAFATGDSLVSKTMTDNFVYIHVNYNPRRAASASQATAASVSPERTGEMLKRLGNPVRFGFPVFVILDEEGNVIHTQDSSFLEEGKGYSQEKTLRFLRAWTPTAVKGAKKQ